MDSRRHFLRGLARAAAGGARPAPPGGSPAPSPSPDPAAAGTPPAPPDAGSRYAGALAEPGWDSGAQAALERSAVLVIGAGAIGTPVLGYLAGAGVGRLGVLDHAEVALADLRAETVHFTPDVGVPKAHSAAVKLGFLNPEIVVEPYQVHFGAANAEGLVAGQDLVVDCSNDSATSALVAQTCARLAIPLVSSGAHSHGGWVISVPATEHACPRCAETGPSEAPAATAGASAGVGGSLLAREALSRLAAVAAAPAASVLRLDLAGPALRRSPLVRRADCAGCGAR